MIAAVAATVLLAASPGVGSTEAGAAIDVTEAQVLGISLQDSEGVVRRALGDPTSVDHSRDEAAEAPAVTLMYDRVTIYLVGNEVYRMTCSAPRCTTKAGIRVGDPARRVVEVYGPAESQSIDGAETLRYNIKATDCWLDFTVTDDQVTGIRMWFDYQ